MIAYHAPDDADRPLFGVSTRRGRLLNLILGVTTTACVAATFVSAFIFSRCSRINAMNVYFVICIALVCTSLLLLIHWYRQGDLNPKFRKMIYFNSGTVLMLCVCANLYIHNVDGYGETCGGNRTSAG